MSFYGEAVVLGVCVFGAPAFIDAHHPGMAALLAVVGAFIIGHMLGHWEKT